MVQISNLLTQKEQLIKNHQATENSSHHT